MDFDANKRVCRMETLNKDILSLVFSNLSFRGKFNARFLK